MYWWAARLPNVFEISRAAIEHQLVVSSTITTTVTRTGRPKKGETDKERLVIGGLVKHHGYQPGGSVSNWDPAKTEDLAKLGSDVRKKVKFSTATVSRFFKKKFPQDGYKGYVAACSRDARNDIGTLLALWQGELPARHAELQDEEQEGATKTGGRRLGRTPGSRNRDDK